MISLVTPVIEHSAASPVAEALHRRFLDLLPAIQRHGHVYFRHVRCWHRLQDALAEMVAIAWKWFLRLAEQGKDATDFPTVIASYAARAVRSSRRLCGQERSKDVLSSRAQQLKHFKVQTLPRCETGTEDNDTIDALRDNTRTPPDEQAAFRLDYPAWLSQLGDRNRRICQDMALGERTKDLAERYGTTQGRISQLRREFMEDWERFTGEPACV
jgi:hypothetical protein